MTAYALRLANSVDTAARVRIGDLLSLTPGATAVTARTGIRPGVNAGTVAVVAGTMGVTVEPFVAWVQGGVSVVQGGYPFVLDAQVTLTLANGHASLSRTDVVAAVVRDDPFDSSGAVTATVEVVQGTPGGGTPALPTNALPLRNVTVPAGLSTGTGGLASGNLSTDRRTYTAAAGGVVTVATQAERDALPAINGTVVYRSDTDALEVRRSTGWHTVAAPWTAYTPALGGGTIGNGTLTGGYSEDGQGVHFWAQLVLGSTTTLAATNTLSLPVASKAGVFPSFAGEAFDTSAGGSIQVRTTYASSTAAYLLVPDTAAGAYDRTLSSSVPFTWAAGDRIYLAGTYQRA